MANTALTQYCATTLHTAVLIRSLTELESVDLGHSLNVFLSPLNVLPRAASVSQSWHHILNLFAIVGLSDL